MNTRTRNTASLALVLALAGGGVALAAPAYAEDVPAETPAVVDETATEETTEAPAEEIPAATEPVVEEETAPPAEEETVPPVEEETTEPPAEEVPPVEEPAAFVPYTVNDSWTLPADWTDPEVYPAYGPAIYDQTLGASCGVWNQNDTYLIESVEEEMLHAAIVADGILTMGEDSAIYQSHTYTFTECVGPNPPNPAGEVTATCGVASVHLTNFRTDDEVENLTASFVVYVDGEFYSAPALVSGQNYVDEITFAEDTGAHDIEVRTGPAFGDVFIAEAKVTTDCEPVLPPTEPETPVVVVPTPEPTPTTETVAVTVTPAASSDDKLADTGASPAPFLAGASALLALGLALALGARVRAARQ